MKKFFLTRGRDFLFQMYVFLVILGAGIGAAEYGNYKEYHRESLTVGGGEVKESGKEEELVGKDGEETERAETIPAKIALTFDDGPHPVYTVQLLDGLRERSVKATFFLIGENIKGREEIVKQMYKDGHLIGNHTWSHVKLTDMDTVKACEEITKTSELVKSITGKNTEYIRPPFGSWDKDLECGFDMFPVLWSVDPLDWTTSNTDRVVEKVVSQAQENDIILLHDCYESSVEAALRIVDILQAKGFEFVTADELILD